MGGADAKPRYRQIFVRQKFGIMNNELGIRNKADKIYESLQKAGVEVLYDDRKEATTGEKFNDADLIGIPYRLVISEKTGNKIEIKERSGKKTRLANEKEILKLL